MGDNDNHVRVKREAEEAVVDATSPTGYPMRMLKNTPAIDEAA